MNRTFKRILILAVLIAIGVGVAYVFRAQPIAVDTAKVVRGPMQVTIDQDAQTRAHDRFTLAAPVTGYLSRIELYEGDPVRRGTVIATVSPMPIDPRDEAEIRARVDSAEALRREAEEQSAAIRIANGAGLRHDVGQIVDCEIGAEDLEYNPLRLIAKHTAFGAKLA